MSRQTHQKDCTYSQMCMNAPAHTYSIYTHMHCTGQCVHTLALIQYFTTKPDVQHLQSTSHHSAISPCLSLREERRGTQAEKKLWRVMKWSKRGCKYMQGRWICNESRVTGSWERCKCSNDEKGSQRKTARSLRTLRYWYYNLCYWQWQSSYTPLHKGYFYNVEVQKHQKWQWAVKERSCVKCEM